MSRAPDLMVLPNANRYSTPKKGHIGQPGAGPVGQSCGTCAHYTNGIQKLHKCLLNRAKWGQSAGTDVRPKDPACQRFMALSGPG